MIFSSPEAFLVHVLRAFEPYLDRLVLVGGFAVRLYEQHPRAIPAATRILRTFDADLATPARLPVRGRPLAALAAAAGLQPDFRGDRIPPVMRFVFAPPSGTAEGEEEYSVEFLTPLTGPPVDRAGRVPVTTDVQAGVTAQRLRYLDLLLETPWRVSLAGLAGLEADREPMAVQVPHPGCFMLHKLLIAGERTREDRRAKDMAYLYQVASMFRRELPALAGEVRVRMEGPAGWRTWLGRARRQGEVLFATPASPGTESHSSAESAPQMPPAAPQPRAHRARPSAEAGRRNPNRRAAYRFRPRTHLGHRSFFPDLLGGVAQVLRGGSASDIDHPQHADLLEFGSATPRLAIPHSAFGNPHFCLGGAGSGSAPTPIPDPPGP